MDLTMKRSFVLTVFALVVFAGGYWAGHRNAESVEILRRSGVAVAAREQNVLTQNVAKDKVKAVGSHVRPFVPGRPFAKGHAREWILGLLPSLNGDRRGRGIAEMNLTPEFLTMDDESVREALAAVDELSAIEDGKDPARRRNPNGDGKLDSLKMLAMIRLAQTNPEEAIAMLKQNFNHNDGTTMHFVFGRLAGDDPRRAEQLALSLDERQQKQALNAVALAVANKDPEAALTLAARHSGILDDRMRKAVLENWSQRDPLPAMTAAVREMENSGNPELVRNTIEEWYKKDPAAAAQWASTHEGTGSVVARAMVLERQAKEDPQAALQEYAALQQAGGDARELARLTGSLADSLAKKDVSAAREWAQTLPEGDLRNRALHRVAEEWVKTDAPAASEWIRTLPSGELRDGAARELSGTLSRRDPVSAFEWARSIQNAKLREGALYGVMQSWREQDPDAAKAALESLPKEMRPPQ